jgi:hypothetical protein
MMTNDALAVGHKVKQDAFILLLKLRAAGAVLLGPKPAWWSGPISGPRARWSTGQPRPPEPQPCRAGPQHQQFRLGVAASTSHVRRVGTETDGSVVSPRRATIGLKPRWAC